MNHNDDFTQRVLIHTDTIDWVASPMKGVDRRMLDRIGDEVARATSIVRYAPESKFSAHTHGGGEEFIVLEGVFQDEHGDFPPGSYIRNPPTSSHTPGSDKGCRIFVKLWQFDTSDRTPVMIDMNKMGTVPTAGRKGVSVMPLFEDDRETVQVETWAAGAKIEIDAPEGAEFLVLDGSFTSDKDEALYKESWLRVPKGDKLIADARADGARVWMKTHHLRFVDPPRA